MRILWCLFLIFGLMALVSHADEVDDEMDEEDDFDEDMGMGDMMGGGMPDEGGVEDEEPPMTEQEAAAEPIDYSTPTCPANTYLCDPFPTVQGIGKRWILSKAKKEGVDDDIAKYNGEWEIGLPEIVSLRNDYGLIVKTKARHHAISSRLPKTFEFNKGKDLIVQYEVKFQNGQECGGAYVKLIQKEHAQDLTQFTDKSRFSIMFGPDKCGLTSKIHFILQFKNPKNNSFEEHHAPSGDKDIGDSFTDKKTHLYTLVLRATGKYEVLLDQNVIMSGSMLEMTPSIVPPKEIEDPEDKKPGDWDENEKIVDPEAKKPENWDETAPEKIDDLEAKMPNDWDESEPEMIDDPKASKPEDWDKEIDGDWEAAKIPNPKCEELSGCGPWTRPQKKNPDYKGKWKAPRIANPNYKGKWSPQMIANPNYFDDTDLFKHLTPFSSVGLELWTMSDGILFDNFIIVDDKTIADDFAEQTWKIKKMQEAKTIAPTGGKSGLFSGLVDAANDKPWLWALYVLVILVPIVLITVFCFSGGSKDDKKKTDEPTADDDNIEDPTQLEDAEDSAAGEDGDASPSTPRRSPRKQANKKEDLEGSEDEEEEEEEDKTTKLRKRKE